MDHKKLLLSLSLFLIAPKLSYADNQQDSLLLFCDNMTSSPVMTEQKSFAKASNFGPYSIGDAGYWKGNWFGYNIPVPVIGGDWNSGTSKILSILSHPEQQINITLSPPNLIHQEDALGDILVNSFNLPRSNLSNFELLKMGLTITPSEVECDTSDIQGTINKISSLFIKSIEIFKDDSVYASSDGNILIHHIYDKGERWRYIFKEEGALLPKQIVIQHWSPGNFKNIGYHINHNPNYSYSSGEPPWLSKFFEDAENNFPKTVKEHDEAMKQFGRP